MTINNLSPPPNRVLVNYQNTLEGSSRVQKKNDVIKQVPFSLYSKLSFLMLQIKMAKNPLSKFLKITFCTSLLIKKTIVYTLFLNA